MLGHFATAESLGHDELKLLLSFSGSCRVLEVLVMRNLQDRCMRLFEGLRGGTCDGGGAGGGNHEERHHSHDMHGVLR